MVPHTVTVASVASVRALYVKHYKKGGGREERREKEERERGLNAKARVLGCLGVLWKTEENELY